MVAARPQTRVRNWKLHNRLGYMIVDWRYNFFVFGGDSDLSPDDVEEYLTGWTDAKGQENSEG
jgi:hypothetical protein